MGIPQGSQTSGREEQKPSHDEDLLSDLPDTSGEEFNLRREPDESDHHSGDDRSNGNNGSKNPATVRVIQRQKTGELKPEYNDQLNPVRLGENVSPPDDMFDGVDLSSDVDLPKPLSGIPPVTDESTPRVESQDPPGPNCSHPPRTLCLRPQQKRFDATPLRRYQNPQLSLIHQKSQKLRGFCCRR